MANKNVNMLIPNVTKLPGQKKVDQSNRLPKQGGNSEFSEILKQQGAQAKQPMHGGLNVSGHAAQRLQERSIDFNGDEFMKVKDAMSKLKDKGAKQSLVVTDKAAYIVDVKNNKLVTAVDKGSMNENVFTKIDSTLFVN